MPARSTSPAPLRPAPRPPCGVAPLPAGAVRVAAPDRPPTRPRRRPPAPAPAPAYEAVDEGPVTLSADEVADALFRVIDNTSEIYNGSRRNAETMLARRYRDGQYQRDRAAAAYAATIDAGVAEFKRELRDDPDAVRADFTAAVRAAVAEALVEQFEGNGHGAHWLRSEAVAAPAQGRRAAPPTAKRTAPAPAAPAPIVPRPAPKAPSGRAAELAAKAAAQVDKAEKLLATARQNERQREGANTHRRKEMAQSMTRREYTAAGEAATASPRPGTSTGSTSASSAS